MRRLIISEQDGVLFNSPFNSAMCSTYQIYTKEIRRMVKQQGEGFWIQFVTSFRSYAVSNHGTDDIAVPMAEDAFIDMLVMLSSNDNLLQLSDLVRSLKALNRALLENDYDVVMHPVLRYLYTRFSKPFFTIKLYFRFFTSFMTLFHRWEGSRRARSASPLASWIPPVHWTNLTLFKNYGRSKFEMFLKAGWGGMLPKLLRLPTSEICWLESEGNILQKCRTKKRHCRKMKVDASQGKGNVSPKTSGNVGNNAGNASTKNEGPEVSIENSSGVDRKLHPHQPSVNKNDLNCMENVSQSSCHSEGNPHGKKAKSVKKANNEKFEKLDEQCLKEGSLQNASSNDVTKNKASDSSELRNKSTLKITSRSNEDATLDVKSNIIFSNNQGVNTVPCKDLASETLKQSSDEVRKQPMKSTSQPVKTNSAFANCANEKMRSRVPTRSKALEHSNNEGVLGNEVCNLTNDIATDVTKTRVEKVQENDYNNPDDVNNNVDSKNTVGWCKETVCNGKELSNQKDSLNGPGLCSETGPNDGSKLKKPLPVDSDRTLGIPLENVFQKNTVGLCKETVRSTKELSNQESKLNGDAKINHSAPASSTETISQTKLKKPLRTDNGRTHGIPSENVSRKNTAGWCKETVCSTKDLSNQKGKLNGDVKIIHSAPASCTETISQTKLKKPLSVDDSLTPRINSVNVLRDEGDTVGTAGKFLGKADNNDFHDGSSPLSNKETKHESVSGFLSEDCSSKGNGTLKEDLKRETVDNEPSVYPTLYHDNEQKAQLTSNSTDVEDSSLLSRGDDIEKDVDTHISGKESSPVYSGDSCNVACTSLKSKTRNVNDFKEQSSSAAHIPGKQSNSVFETVKVASNRTKDSESVKNGEDPSQKRTNEHSDSFSTKGSTSRRPNRQPKDPCPKEKTHLSGTSYGRPLPPPRCRQEKIYLHRKCDNCNILEHTPGFYKRCSRCIEEGVNRPKVYCGPHCQYVDWIRAHKKEHKSL